MMFRALVLSFLLSCGLVPVGNAAVVRTFVCAPTAEAAVAHMLGNLDTADVSDGFRVVNIRVDQVRGQKWAMVASCKNPSAPLTAVILPQSAAVVEQTLNVGMQIRIGDRVRVVRHSADSSYEIEGWAEANGYVGDMVRVRLPRLSEDTSAPAPEMNCRVVAHGLVEATR